MKQVFANYHRSARTSSRVPRGNAMIKKGTLCYVVPECRASPRAMGALGRIVEVVGGPFTPPPRADAGTYYDVRFRQHVFYCQADKLRPINDPDADVGAPLDGSRAS